MATAIASESASQLAILGLSEEDFKRKTELMRLYLQDSSGAASFEEFCQQQPPRLPDPAHPPQPPKPASSEAPKSTSNNTQKPHQVVPTFPSIGIPLPSAPVNGQMFGIMPPSQVSKKNLRPIVLTDRFYFNITVLTRPFMHGISSSILRLIAATTSRVPDANADACRATRPDTTVLPSSLV